MKASLLFGIAFSLAGCAISPGTEVPTQKPGEATVKAQNQKNIDICTQNLIAIGKAIKTYQKEHGDLPEWLSELYPKYLPDANLLLCPADEGGGKSIFTSNVDPKMPVSYGYQFHPEYRKEKTEQREVYGDAMPLVRCRQHADQPFDCLNLSFDFRVYTSSHVWESKLEEIYGSPEAAITALERYPDDPSFSDFYLRLFRLYIKVGREKDAESLINRFKSVMNPEDIESYRTLFSMLDSMERYEDLLEIFKEAEQQHPDAEPILWRLGHIHRKLGNIQLADIYDRKADPKYELWGKPVTDFSTTDLDGNPISLQQYRGKVVLLGFWETGCGFCIKEIPNLKNVYDTYKDMGFDIIGVSLDDETELRDYIKENNIQWRQICSGERGKNDPLVQQYKITGVPEQWLIDRDGKLITHKARGEALEGLVVEALKGEPENR
ncbi:MAG: redoxin domain-containing protein [Candidatus Poribacteria bacterium]|nr:redoxin domain-containing protein [Candidatus Poribacteria bacterium]